MYIGLTPELTELRDELRDYYAKLLTPEVEAELSTGEGIGPVPRKIWKQMAADGWAGIGWPEEYGGQGRTAIEQFIFFDESMRVGAPVPMLTINSVAPTIMRYGSQEQKDFFLPEDPRRARSTSPSGTPSPTPAPTSRRSRPGPTATATSTSSTARRSSPRSRADSDYIWLAVRTDQNVKKHKGISIIIVPTDTPGFKYEPIKNMGGLDTNVTYYEDVRVPVGNLVGGENQGWNLITNQLNHERVTLCASGVVERQLEDTIAWAAATKNADGTRVIDQEWVQINLAKVHAKLEFLQARELQGRGRGDPGCAAEPGRRVGHQGVRHRVLPRGVPAPHGDHRPVGAGEVRFAGGGPQGSARSAACAACTSSRSAAGRTRCSATSSPSSASTCPAHPGRRRTTMDFTLSEEQQELQGLAKQILGDRMALTHLRELDNSEDWFDRETWAEFAKANLLGVALPEDIGGLGYGFLELCLILVEQGRTVAPLPLIHTLVSVALPIAEFGTPEQRKELAGVISGDMVLTSALNELGTPADEPQTIAERSGDGWRITGEKVNVPQAHIADGILVPARVGQDIGLFLVWPKADGITLERQETMNHEPQFVVKLDGVEVTDAARIGEIADGREHLRWILDRTMTGHLRDHRGCVPGGAADHRRVHDDAQAVRPRDRHVPGRRPAHGRLLHRHRGDQPHDAPGRDAPRPGPGVTDRGRDREVLGGRGWQPGRARGAARPRRHQHRPRLPDPPLLPLGEAGRVHARCGDPVVAGSRSDDRRFGVVRTRASS